MSYISMRNAFNYLLLFDGNFFKLQFTFTSNFLQSHIIRILRVELLPVHHYSSLSSKLPFFHESYPKHCSNVNSE